MIILENVKVYGWEESVRGMRNPMNSWEKRDSTFGEEMELGPNDMELMRKLRRAGRDHRKFMRMIVVSLDITAPLYWWKEFDTYKVGTVVNSCSTMHTLHKRDLELCDFSKEYLLEGTSLDVLEETIRAINRFRHIYLATGCKEKTYWHKMIQLLPSSYNQTRTVMLNYEVLANIYAARKEHKLDEWRKMCSWMEKDLPMAELITGKVED